MKWTRDEGLEEEVLNTIWDGYRDDSRVQPSLTGMIKCLTRTYIESSCHCTEGNQVNQDIVEERP